MISVFCFEINSRHRHVAEISLTERAATVNRVERYFVVERNLYSPRNYRNDVRSSFEIHVRSAIVNFDHIVGCVLRNNRAYPDFTRLNENRVGIVVSVHIDRRSGLEIEIAVDRYVLPYGSVIQLGIEVFKRRNIQEYYLVQLAVFLTGVRKVDVRHVEVSELDRYHHILVSIPVGKISLTLDINVLQGYGYSVPYVVRIYQFFGGSNHFSSDSVSVAVATA